MSMVLDVCSCTARLYAVQSDLQGTIESSNAHGQLMPFACSYRHVQLLGHVQPVHLCPESLARSLLDISISKVLISALISES
jgi:hypothetical protein